MKRILVLVSAFMLVFAINIFANTDVKVLMNDELINFTDENNQVVNAEITNDRTMVPLRKIFEELGATVEWNDDTKTITATKGNREINLVIGSETAYLTSNGQRQINTLDSVPYIKEGRTLVPLRFISESLGCLVGWDSSEKTAIIISLEDLINEILAECTNLKDFVTNVKTSDKKYFDILVDGTYKGTMFDEEFCQPINIEMFNNDDGIYLKVIKFFIQDSMEGKYYNLGELLKNNNIKTVDDILDLVNKEDNVKIGEYTNVKDEYIKIFNNNNFTCKIEDNKKIYTFDYSEKSRESSILEDGNMGIIKIIDVKFKVIINTEDDVINKLFVLITQNDNDDQKIELNININYSNTQRELPKDTQAISITDFIKLNNIM